MSLLDKILALTYKTAVVLLHVLFWAMVGGLLGAGAYAVYRTVFA